MRTRILLVLLFGIVGVLIELLLLGHTEDRRQWIPIATLAMGAGTVLWHLLRPRRLTGRMMLAVMSTFVASGVLGVWYHFSGNREFEIELRPSMEGFELFREAMTGATPALAPGTMVLLGLIGLVATLGTPDSPHDTPTEEES
ncbi:MAG: hypothetical protein RQ745_10460 [Longimicrobiales bacterium]|nr:hypothetical protein [Longimicrobiales bacterium]